MQNDTQLDDDLDFGDDDFGTDTPDTVEQVDTDGVSTDTQAATTATELVDGTESAGQVASEQMLADVPADQQVAEKSDEEKAAEAKAAAEAEQADFDAKLASFKEAVGVVLKHEGRDPDLGTLPEVAHPEIIAAYAALPKAKGKAAGKAFLQEAMQTAMVAGEFANARSYMELNNLVKEAKATKSTETIAKVKVDPTEEFVNRIAALMLAPSLVPVPSDVKEGWDTQATELAETLGEQVVAYKEWAEAEVAEGAERPDAPEVHEVVVTAYRLAQGRAVTKARRASSGGTPSTPRPVGSGHRGDMAQHIREAFATVAVGDFLSIAEIGKVTTSQYNGDKPAPSQGAISARIFPDGDPSKSTLDFVRGEGKDQGRPVKGAVKTSTYTV